MYVILSADMRFRPYNPPPEEHRACPVSGKRMFADEREAQAEADRIRNDGGAALQVYFCLSCDHWHFTSAGRSS